ncbi:MAG: hypothetical protein FIA99_10010 [Ruminiclostridium sp.]|nr:hypothetical protein [Ruminiclostridium sp.]
MELIDIYKKKQLMIDNHIIEMSGGARHLVHQWEKDSGNPVLSKRHEWEGMGLIGPGIMEYDPIDKKYKMWYSTYNDMGKYNQGYAESNDGLEWITYPEPCITEENLTYTVAIVIDPRGKAGDYRFHLIGFFRRTPELPGRGIPYRSRDGITWEPYEGSPWWLGPGDSIKIIWDSKRECFVSYYDVVRVAGKLTNGVNVKGYYVDYDFKQKDCDILEFDGIDIFPERHDTHYEFISKKLGENDGGGLSITEDVQMIRVICRAESRDLVNWTDSRVILEPDEYDYIDAQYAHLPVFEYEGIYMAYADYMRSLSGKIEEVYAFSRDGVNFTVPDKKPAIACGPEGSWDAGMVLVSSRPLEINGRLCIYYGAFNSDHAHVDTAVSRSAIGRAWMRKDGFVSVTGGTVRTKLLSTNGGALHINAAGRIAIRILDVSGNILEAASWEGDSTDAKAVQDIGKLLNKPVRIEFDLGEAGHLYSFWSE